MVERSPERRFDRRALISSGAGFALSVSPLAAILSACQEDAEESGPLRAGFVDWILRLHPAVDPAATPAGRSPDLVRPSIGADVRAVLAEAAARRSSWDLFVGITPFVEMVELVEAGALEPWDEYIPDDVVADVHPKVRREARFRGRLYSWPFLLDVVVQGWNTELVERAGLDPTIAPRDWDEYIQNARTVRRSGGASYGCTFDARGWRSLAPIAYSIDPAVHTEDGLFDFTNDAVVEALEVMRRMYELAPPDVLDPGTTAGAGLTPDEGSFASQLVAYYIKYQNAQIRFAATWPDPGRLSLGPLPKASPAGRTVFWTAGVALLRHGRQRARASRYVRALTYDEVIWRNSLSGRSAAGHVPVYRTLWKQWRRQLPSWVDRWAFRIYAEMDRARSIPPHRLGATQFTVGQPHWERYLRREEPNARKALSNAMNAVRKRAA